jgi:hypothetical protein
MSLALSLLSHNYYLIRYLHEAVCYVNETFVCSKEGYLNHMTSLCRYLSLTSYILIFVFKGVDCASYSASELTM